MPRCSLIDKYLLHVLSIRRRVLIFTRRKCQVNCNPHSFTYRGLCTNPIILYNLRPTPTIRSHVRSRLFGGDVDYGVAVGVRTFLLCVSSG